MRPNNWAIVEVLKIILVFSADLSNPLMELKTQHDPSSCQLH